MINQIILMWKEIVKIISSVQISVIHVQKWRCRQTTSAFHMQPVHWGHQKRIKVLVKIRNRVVSYQKGGNFPHILAKFECWLLDLIGIWKSYAAVCFSCLMEPFQLQNRIKWHLNTLLVVFTFSILALQKAKQTLKKQTYSSEVLLQHKAQLSVWGKCMYAIFALRKHPVITVT